MRPLLLNGNTFVFNVCVFNGVSGAGSGAGLGSGGGAGSGAGLGSGGSTGSGVGSKVGVVAVGLCLLGTFVIVIMGEKKSLGLVLGLLATLVMLAIFYTFNYGIDILYERGLTYAMLMMGIVAGYALMYIRTFDLPPEIELPFNRQFIKIAGIVVCVALIGITFAIAIPARQNTRYYHMITDEDYKAFVWISENVNDDYQKALINPWKSTAFVAITGKYVYSRTHSYPTARDEEAMAFLRRGCTDTSFLEQNGLSMVYTELSCNNEDLQKVSENVYLLK